MGDSFSSLAGAEGKGLEADADPGDGDGPLGDEGVDTEVEADGAVADFEGHLYLKRISPESKPSKHIPSGAFEQGWPPPGV